VADQVEGFGVEPIGDGDPVGDQLGHPVGLMVVGRAPGE
jgi:hypothetical protein